MFDPTNVARTSHLSENSPTDFIGHSSLYLRYIFVISTWPCKVRYKLN